MRRKNNKNKPKAATAKCGGEKMKKLTKSEALEQGYEMCVADWMGVREDGVIESQLIEDIETEDLEAEEHYLLEKEPYKFVEGEPIYHRTDIILIP